MNLQKQLKFFGRAIARNGLYATYWLAARLPIWAVQGITHFFIAIGFRLTMRQRWIARESLNIALGMEKTTEEIEQIIRDCFENLGRGMIEMLYYLSHPQKVKEDVFFDGKPYLDQALQEGKGVIAVTAHFGNFPLMMLHCALEGYKTNTIIRPARDNDLEDFLFRKRTESGLNTVYAIPRKRCVDDSLKVLRNNELLFIPLDQNFGSNGGVFVDFFGQKAATATGPVVFAMRTKAVILPMFIVREKNNKHRIIIEPPLQLEQRDDEKEAILINTGKITKLIEQYIRKYPHEWGWMHRRWKSRPS